MSMIDIHQAALESSSGPFHEFLLFYQRSIRVVYGFVEGKEDPSFYKSIIDHELPFGWTVKLIPSGSKSSVLGVLHNFPWGRFEKGRVCFFIDRDLSELIESEGEYCNESLYVTEGYSIENDIVNAYVFIRLLEEVFGVSNLTATETVDIERHFERNLNQFCEDLVPIMAQILIWRRSGIKANLSDLKLKQIFDFVGASLSYRNGCDHAGARLNALSNALKIELSSEEERETAEAHFRAADGAKRLTRGKYLIWFLVEYSSAVHAAIPSICSRHNSVPKVKIQIGPGNAMGIVGPRAMPSQTLISFIKKNYCKFISEFEVNAVVSSMSA